MRKCICQYLHCVRIMGEKDTAHSDPQTAVVCHSEYHEDLFPSCHSEHREESARDSVRNVFARQ